MVNEDVNSDLHKGQYGGLPLDSCVTHRLQNEACPHGIRATVFFASKHIIHRSPSATCLFPSVLNLASKAPFFSTCSSCCCCTSNTGMSVVSLCVYSARAVYTGGGAVAVAGGARAGAVASGAGAVADGEGYVVVVGDESIFVLWLNVGVDVGGIDEGASVGARVCVVAFGNMDGDGVEVRVVAWDKVVVVADEDELGDGDGDEDGNGNELKFGDVVVCVFKTLVEVVNEGG
jgi:hypothetical protein